MPEPQGTHEPHYPQPRSFRLDDLSRSLLDQLATKLGVSQADIVRLAIRKYASLEGLSLKAK